MIFLIDPILRGQNQNKLAHLQLSIIKEVYSYLTKNETLIFGEKCSFNPWNSIPDLNLPHQLRQVLAKHVIFPINPKNSLTIQSSNLVLDSRNSTLAPHQSYIINYTPGALIFASNMSPVQELQPIWHYPTPVLEHGSSPVQWSPTLAPEHKLSSVQWSPIPASEHRSSPVQWSLTPAPEHRSRHLRSSPIPISILPSSSLALYQSSLQISSRLGEDQQQGGNYTSPDFEPIPWSPSPIPQGKSRSTYRRPKNSESDSDLELKYGSKGEEGVTPQSDNETQD